MCRDGVDVGAIGVHSRELVAAGMRRKAGAKVDEARSLLVELDL